MVISADNYNVITENGALSRVGSLSASAVKPCRSLIITDTNVHGLYSAAVIRSLRDAGFTVAEYIIPAGEENKTLDQVSEILSAAADSGLTRSDVMFALGGGVVGDMTGFAASIYMRGIRYISIPTTLLSMVDSSIGGKTGVDLAAGKNLAGAFHEPSLVISDPEVLSTLPPDEFSCGMAEVIKTAMIGCAVIEPLLDDVRENIENIISECVKFKLGVVSRDPFDKGERRLLNFGHTVGHAIEKASDYTVTHGQAVAAGMYVMTKAAVLRGICGFNVLERLGELLKKFGLDPYLADRFSSDELAEAISHDKKKNSGVYTVIMPTSFGQAELYEVGDNEINEIIRGTHGKKMIMSSPACRDDIVAHDSKSHLHRLFILAALADKPSTIVCGALCDDAERTLGCLCALGAKAERTGEGINITPIDKDHLPSHALLDCGESGTTFRFMLALTAALGVDAVLKLSGNLPARPISPLADVLVSHGAVIDGLGTDAVSIKGKLNCGEYVIGGGVSSQFTSALLLALTQLPSSYVRIVGDAVSEPYVEMTVDALNDFGYGAVYDGVHRLTKSGTVKEIYVPEKDWSGAAFALVRGALSSGVTVRGLDTASRQGDRKIIETLQKFGANVDVRDDSISISGGEIRGTEVNCEDTPDLVPALFVLALFAEGTTVISGVARLKDKESDRIGALLDLADALNVKAEYHDGVLSIVGQHKEDFPPYCTVAARGDHRIAMAAAVVAAISGTKMIIDDVECIKKSYPTFFGNEFVGF